MAKKVRRWKSAGFIGFSLPTAKKIADDWAKVKDQKIKKGKDGYFLYELK